MRHLIEDMRISVRFFFDKDENYPKIVMSVLGFELGFIAARMIITLT